MDSLKELDDYLKKKPNGMSLGELKEVFADEASLKKFTKAGLDCGRIIKEGEKRGTKYFSASVDKASVDLTNAKDYETEGLNAYLSSDKPVPGTAFFVNEKPFGPGGSKNIRNFFMSGKVVENIFVSYDKALKKNVVCERSDMCRNNTIGFKVENREYVMTKYDHFAGSVKKETYESYEEFREAIRVLFI